jgi:two-component system, NtrC family, response regulator HydG
VSAASAPVLLVIDDEPGMLALVERVVRSTGFKTILHTSAREALAMLPSESADAALVDLQMPELGGLDVLRAIRQAQPQCGVILMTAHASVDSAIEAVKLGALDYLTKPLDIERLRQLLTDVREDVERRAELLASESATAKRMELCGMIGRSAVMQQLFGLVRRIAPHARAALVTGETGAGKEGIARAVHQLGPRRSKRFVTVNCSAVVETLFESELFGHARGAFTGATDNKIGMFEAADGGTIFLDEIGELPPAVQAKLLRVLEAGEVQRVGSLQPRKVDVRIVAATNRDLRAEVDAGRFRTDLFYRLNVVELSVPPLRDRREDIPYLTAAFVKEFSQRFEKGIEGVSPAAERILMSGNWPGNVRELRNVLERACMLSDGRTLNERDVHAAMPSARETRPAADERGGDLGAIEKEHIVRVLADVRGNKLEAARRLGISRRTLYRRLERHGLMEPAAITRSEVT